MSFSIRDNMYEVILSGETPIAMVQKCVRELKPKTLWCEFDVENTTLVIDATNCNLDDVRGTIMNSIGVEYINEIKD